MGSGRWDSDSYRSYSSSTSSMDAGARFSASTSAHDVLKGHTAHLNPTGVKSALNPTGTRTRESRDSADNPNSTPIIVGLDVTGSMGRVINYLAGTAMGTLFEEILTRKPVPDPHLMFMGIGDAEAGDQVPLQVSQFEADNRIVKQLTDLYLEGGGGGNEHESYNLPWYYAATHTSTDAFEKRQRKGYLFTVGDESVPGPLRRQDIKRVVGDEVERDFSNEELLTMAGRMYHVFHVMVGEGDFAGRNERKVREAWSRVLGQHALWLPDHRKLSELIVSAIQVNEGADADAVSRSWGGDTSLVVANAVRGLSASSGSTAGDGTAGVTRL